MDKADGESKRIAHATQLKHVRRPYQARYPYQFHAPTHEPTPSNVIRYSRNPVKSQPVPVPVRGTKLVPRKLKKNRKQHHKGLRGLLVACCVMMLIAVLLFSQGNGGTGAWFADTFRAVLGPSVTAQIESWYLGFNDAIHQAQYQLNGKKVNAPWKVAPTPTIHILPNTLNHPGTPRVVAMNLSRIPSIITPAMDGEGSWIVQATAPSPYDYLPLGAKTFIRPDPTHPYALVTLLQFDNRFIALHMVAGTSQPGGPVGVPGPGLIPASDQNGHALLAAFNGGFKYADGQYGMAVGRTLYVPPQAGAATIAVTKKGQIIMGTWGVDPRLNSTNADLVMWRQNASLLIDKGVINPLTQDGSAWGGTILNSAYTWRSGIGITAQGTLLYAAGNSLTARTLAVALKAAGAVMAMQTDINPYWVRAFLYNRNSQGTLGITKLNPDMYGSGTEYLYGTARDFFYVTRITPTFAPPSPLHPH